MIGPPRRSQRFVLIILLTGVVLLALLMPSLIDIYTGAPRAQGPGEDLFQVPTSVQTANQSLARGDTFSLQRPSATPTTRPQTEENCTRDRDYWLTHQESWPSAGMSFGNLIFDTEAAFSLISSGAGDVRTAILRELILYSLNTLRGADPSAVLATVHETRSWLNTHASTEALSEADQQTGYQLASSLEAFNRGLLGPGPCPEVTDTPTPTATPSASPTFAPTPSPTNTPTSQPQLPPPPPPPTDSPKPRKTKPPKPTAVPTQPPPTPEPTQPPPPTAVPTQPPRPTAVPPPVPTPTSPP